MTSLGLNTAAVPEAAALFPVAAAASAAADDTGAAVVSFGDLLAATVAPSEPAAAATAKPTDPVSMADAWFASLNVDFSALNAGLDGEDISSKHASSLDADAVAADESSQVKDGDAAQDISSLIAVPVPVAPVPVIAAGDVAFSVSNLLTESAEHVTTTPGSQSGPNALASVAQGLSAAAPTTSEEAVPYASDAAPVAAASEPVQRATARGSEHPARHTPTAHASTVAPPLQQDGLKDATSEGMDGSSDVRSAIGEEPSAPAVAHAAGRPTVPGPAAVSKPVNVQPHMAAEATAVVRQAPSAQQQQEGAADAAPVVQPAVRTREAIAAKLAEIAGFAPVGSEVAPSAQLAGDFDARSQSESGSGQGHDLFAPAIQESAGAVRSADSGSTVMPAFAVTTPGAPGAAHSVTHTEVPQAVHHTSVPTPENVGRLIESMRVQVRQGVQEATVRLNPEHLGEVTIQVKVENGSVSAVVRAETPAVQQWLEAQEDKLRSGLSDQGLHLERFFVHRDGSQERREQPQSQRQPQASQRYRQQRQDQTVRFEVIV